MRIIALIPARGGSKRIPRKNIKLLNGKPLIAYVIKSALESDLDEVWVSTEDNEIKDISQQYGALVLDRPAELAEDTTSTEAVMAHFLEHVSCDVLVLIEPPHPLIRPEDINGALTKFIKTKCDSLVTLENKKLFVWELVNDEVAEPINFDPANRPRMQDFEGCYLETVGIWITTVDAFANSHCRLSGKVGYYVVPHVSIDIDDEIDFKIAELILKEEGM